MKLLYLEHQLPDEAISLSTGFLQAGVAGIVASLWPVDDLSTMLVMTKFYNLWYKDRKEPSEALREAQLWMSSTTDGQKADYLEDFLPELTSNRTNVGDAYNRFRIQPDNRIFSHPFYWAAFIYVGA